MFVAAARICHRLCRAFSRLLRVTLGPAEGADLPEGDPPITDALLIDDEPGADALMKTDPILARCRRELKSASGIESDLAWARPDARVGRFSGSETYS